MVPVGARSPGRFGEDISTLLAKIDDKRWWHPTGYAAIGENYKKRWLLGALVLAGVDLPTHPQTYTQTCDGVRGRWAIERKVPDWA